MSRCHLEILASNRRLPLVYLFLFALATLWPGQGAATTARIQALGGNGAFLEDESNVLRWCGSLTDYPDLAVLETGGFNLYWGYNNEEMDLVSGPGGGIHGGFGENDRWGTVAVYFHGRNLDTPLAGISGGGLNGALSMIYARPIGPFSAALKFRRGSASSTAVIGTASAPAQPLLFHQDLTETELGGGLRIDLTETAYLDLAGEIRLTEIKEKATAGDLTLDEYESNSSNNFQIRSRAFIQLGEKSALIPVAEVMLTDTPLTSDPLFTTYQLDHHMIRVGCGINYFPDTDRFLMFSAEYRGGETEFTGKQYDDGYFTQKWDWDQFLCDLGMESRFLSWLTLRTSLHYQYRWGSETWTNPDVVVINSEGRELEGVRLYGNLGVGMHLGRYDLDLALTHNYPDTPAGFIGYSEFQDDQSWLTATLQAHF